VNTVIVPGSAFVGRAFAFQGALSRQHRVPTLTARRPKRVPVVDNQRQLLSRLSSRGGADGGVVRQLARAVRAGLWPTSATA